MGAVYGTSRGYALDTRPATSDSKRVFDRGGCHRRTWRQVYGKALILYANLANLYYYTTKHFRLGRCVENRRSINSNSLPKWVYWS
jgi:hypothetical protein